MTNYFIKFGFLAIFIFPWLLWREMNRKDNERWHKKTLEIARKYEN